MQHVRWTSDFLGDAAGRLPPLDLRPPRVDGDAVVVEGPSAGLPFSTRPAPARGAEDILRPRPVFGGIATVLLLT